MVNMGKMQPGVQLLTVAVLVFSVLQEWPQPPESKEIMEPPGLQ
jgi:hypothetical protein